MSIYLPYSFANHERSKKHKENVALLKQLMTEEEEQETCPPTTSNPLSDDFMFEHQASNAGSEHLHTQTASSSHEPNELLGSGACLSSKHSKESTDINLGLEDLHLGDVSSRSHMETIDPASSVFPCEQDIESRSNSEESADEDLSYAILRYLYE